MLHYFTRTPDGHQIEHGAPPLRERARDALAAKHARLAQEAAQKQKVLTPMERAYQQGVRDTLARVRVG